MRLPNGFSLAGLLLLSCIAPAASAQYTYNDYFTSNATNYCQAFTPGVSNTLRNRAAGVENVGAVSMAVACSITDWTRYVNTFGVTNSGSMTYLGIRFANPTAQSHTINCTLLKGHWSNVISTVNRSVVLPPGADAGMFFNGTDLGETRQTSVNINCTLPPNTILSQIQYVRGMN